MTFLCIRYSGLKFNFIFETKDFIFIPVKEVEDKERDIGELEEIFSCSYDKNSEFYVMLKEPGEFDLSLEDSSEKYLYQFKLLEAILNLLFSNFLRRDCIFMLEKDSSQFIVKKIFKNLSKESTENNQTFLWKNNIIIKYLQELIDAGFDKFRTITRKEDFAIRYSFCIDMYLRGKFGENRLRFITDLWISLEILSGIIVSHILHTHEFLEVKHFYKGLKELVQEYSSRISEDNIDCWEEMKEKFPEHMKNKINKHLPIGQKCVKVAEKYLDIYDIKVKLGEEANYEDATKYQEYLDSIREFKDYQDSLSIKKIINYFYKYRNGLFHGGKIIDKWSLKFDRYKANFIKILEQLFFKCLSLDMVGFYQMGYPYQKIFGFPNEDMDLRILSNKISVYIYKHCIEPLLTDFKNPFNDLEIARENYIEKKHPLDPLRNQLNLCFNKISEFLGENHPVGLAIDGISYNNSIDYKDINDQTILLKFSFSSGIYEPVHNKKRVIIKNRDTTNITTEFIGMFDDNNVRYGYEQDFAVPFLINPPYIAFEFN